MHEVALCRQLASAVTRAAGERVPEAVYVKVGAMRQVVPEAMQHAWGFTVRGTPLDRATLHLETVPAVLSCDECGNTRQLERDLGFTCRDCGSARTHLTSGEEFCLTAIDVRDPAPETPPPAPPPEGRRHGSLSPS